MNDIVRSLLSWLNLTGKLNNIQTFEEFDDYIMILDAFKTLFPEIILDEKVENETFIEYINKFNFSNISEIITVKLDDFLNCDPYTIEEIVRRMFFLMDHNHRIELIQQIEKLEYIERQDLKLLLEQNMINKKYLKLAKSIRAYSANVDALLANQKIAFDKFDDMERINEKIIQKEEIIAKNQIKSIAEKVKLRNTLNNANEELRSYNHTLQREVNKESIELDSKETEINNRLASIIHQNKKQKTEIRKLENGIKPSASFDEKYQNCVESLRSLKENAKDLSIAREQISKEYKDLKEERKHILQERISELKTTLSKNIHRLEEERTSGESFQMLQILIEERKKRDDLFKQYTLAKQQCHQIFFEIRANMNSQMI